MRVVVPFTPAKLDPRTSERVSRFAVQAEYRDVSASTHAYHALVAELWADGETFALVEHDIGIEAETLASFETCDRPWCGFGYPVGTRPPEDCVVALGCTRFSASLLVAEPDAPWVVQAFEAPDIPSRDWRRLDTRLGATLMQRGYEVHRHHPDVAHYHPY